MIKNMDLPRLNIPSHTVQSNILTIRVINAPSVPHTVMLQAARTTTYTNIPDTINAIVKDQYGKPMSGVTVRLTDLTTHTMMTNTTNAEGVASFTVKFPHTGDYQFKADVI